ncbi:hypothetical protein ABW11_21025 [Pluralibacter gergoviae]|uniref:hypothetical protein n=1 Tax=Pluralibacter gergoviae TaxID=61647 RepID=UPI0006507216|nr:hypothetical protein [Pluralibacter gergoviae]KMK23096.1 hypothetical protein ABW11_21025 [Pluralibacter gergoviae]
MARKTMMFTVDARNRDSGKTFKITEMPARQAEEWAMRVVCAMVGTGANVPDSVMHTLGAATQPEPEDPAAAQAHAAVMASGMAGLAKFGLTALAKVPFAESRPLMDELLGCVQFAATPTTIIPLDESHVEEASTWFRLKLETLKLHLAFLNATAG